jgi:hypothetical protein
VEWDNTALGSFTRMAPCIAIKSGERSEEGQMIRAYV